MDDRISNLPEEILCHILSFLPTKQCVATCLVSKRWKPLWRYVPTFHFNDDYSHSLIKSVKAFMLSRDLDTPLQRFYLHCMSISPLIGKQWIAAAAQGRVEYLDIGLIRKADLTSAIVSCRTLVVLRLFNVHLSFLFNLSSPHFPVLKNLHLHYVKFSEYRDLADLFSGTPSVEDLQVTHLHFLGYICEENFKPLPKLVKADIVTDRFPLEILCNVKDLFIGLIKHGCLIPEFQNLTSLRFCYHLQGLNVIDFINHCPKLQVLDVCHAILRQECNHYIVQMVYPPNLPKCIVSQLKRCPFYQHHGEYRFPRNVIQSARHLVTKLSSWCSTICKFLF